MFNKRSKLLFVTSLLASLYVLYLISYFGGAMGDLNSADEIGGAIATALVTPHMVVLGVGAIFSWIGFFSRKSWAVLTSAILYCVGALLFLLYIIFCLPLIILGFISYSKQKKINKCDVPA